MDLTLSVEDTNRIRQELKLPLIPLSKERPELYNLKKRAAQITDRLRRNHETEQRNDASTTFKVQTIMTASEESELNLSESNTTVDSSISKEHKSTETWLESMKTKKKDSNKEVTPDNAPDTVELITKDEIEVPDRREKQICGDDEVTSISSAVESSGDTASSCATMELDKEAQLVQKTQVSKESYPRDTSLLTTKSQFDKSILQNKQSSSAQRAIFKPKKAKSQIKSRRNRETRILSIEPDLDTLIAQTRKKLNSEKEETVLKNQAPNTLQLFGRNPLTTHRSLHFDLKTKYFEQLESQKKSEESVGAAYKSEFINEGLSTLNAHQISSGQTSGAEGGYEEDKEDQDGDEEEKRDEFPNVGLAYTLRKLKSAKTPADRIPTRHWAKRIAEKSRMRDEELQSLANKHTNLPAHERDQIIDLHKKRLLREQNLEAAEIIKNYKPRVTLEHRNEQGDIIRPKEAFKRLSRAFHGN